MKKSGLKKLFAGFSAALVAASAVPIVIPAASAADTSKIYGDASCDGTVKINDAVLVLQAISSADKYGINGTNENHITEMGCDLADVYQRGGGLTTMDALSIQKYLIGTATLPESFMEGYSEDDPKEDVTYIHLKNNEITVEGKNADVHGTTVTITHSGSYYIDGTLDEGQIAVSIPDETADADTVKIFLNGANICGKYAPAIHVFNAENTSVNIVDGTENTITDGDAAYSGDFAGCALIEANDDITFKGGELGTGSLSLTANFQNAVVCNNDIKFNGGIINIETKNKTDKTNAVNGKKSVTIKSGTITVDAEGDGIKSSKGNVVISGGKVRIKAGNDAVQADTSIDISGGTTVAGGDRGFTAEKSVNITGGTVVATATDNQSASVTASGQAVMLLNCIDCPDADDLMWKKTNVLTVNGNDVITKWEKKYKYVLISEPSIQTGKTYTLTNASTGTAVLFGENGSEQFSVTDAVTAFDMVDPLGNTVVPSPVPAIDTDNFSITLSGASIMTNAPSDKAFVENGVLTITQEGKFTVSGEGNGTQIVIDVDKNAYPNASVELELSGMSLENTNTAPVYVASIGDEAVITAKKGTENTISDGKTHSQTYTDSDGNVNIIEGAVFSRDDIKFKGSGSLTVNGNQDDAIVGKNDIKIYNGSLAVNAVDDGIRGKDSVIIGDDSKSDGSAVDYSNLKVTVNTSAGDGIKATATDTAEDKSYGLVVINGGKVDITSYADGIQAEQELVMNGGDVNISTYQGSGFTGTATGGNTGGWGGRGGFGGMQDGNSNKVDISAKGIKAVGLYDEAGTTWKSSGNITINGGSLTIDSSDDCIHCSGDMELNGGILSLASADDGAHSDHKLTIGNSSADDYDDIMITVTKSYEGIEGVEIVQNSGTVLVTSVDDGFNAAGGSDGSGNANPGGWGQGSWGMPSAGSGNYCMTFNGGFALVNVTDGDHDGYDSNGNIVLSGGIQVTNGNEPFDCGDSGNSITVNGSTWVSNCGSGGMGGFGGSSMSASVTASSSASAGTRISLVKENQVIVSFLAGKSVSQFKAGGTDTSGAKFSIGGTVNGGKKLDSSDGKQTVYIGGTLSGASAI